MSVCVAIINNTRKVINHSLYTKFQLLLIIIVLYYVSSSTHIINTFVKILFVGNAELNKRTESSNQPKQLRTIRKRGGLAIAPIILRHFKGHSSSETDVCSDPKSQKPDNSNLSSKPVIIDTPLSIGIEGTTRTSANSTEKNNDTSCVVEES